MGYTSGTAMEDRGLRDIERWRDKIEVRLDNRQVFFLFFGSALVACMLFVLGVIVGKRLESRGRAVAPEIEDPLALLDKVASSPKPAQSTVTFPQTLFGAGAKTEKHVKKAGTAAASAEEDVHVKPVSLASVEHKSSEAAAKTTTTAAEKTTPPKSQTKTEAKTTELSSDESAPGKETKATEGKETKPTDKPIDKAAADAKMASKSKPSSGDGKPASKLAVADSKTTKPSPDSKIAVPALVSSTEGKGKAAVPALASNSDGKGKAAVPALASNSDGKGKARFALQLSSFQTKAEAEAFAQKFEAEHPYMVVSDIPGKGVWYRVRVGDYASAKDALVAKQSFEKKHSVIAYVAQK